jgi:hypothetical protein
MEHDDLRRGNPLGPLVPLHLASHFVHTFLADPLEGNDPCECHRNLLVELQQPYALSQRSVKRGLHEPLSHSPLVLSNEDAAELGEPIRAVLERTDDVLALLDRQREVARPRSSPSRSVLAAGLVELPPGRCRPLARGVLAAWAGGCAETSRGR